MASSSSGCRHVILTGSPGVGKTTLIRKLCEALKTKGLPVTGFYTQECRQSGTRIGFDVVTLDGHRAPLARVEDGSGHSACRVGKYNVLVQSFEQAALPTLSPASAAIAPVLVVDEIGKMEMFSGNFQKAVSQLLCKKDVTLLATIPVRSANPIPLVEEVRRHPEVRLFEVTRVNREHILDEILKVLETAHRRTQGSQP